ncbi:MAG TPA: SCO family protein [Candidatus Binataceae bacterium]|nr:SCO family protein [Candidatus Binataceae bacterium]
MLEQSNYRRRPPFTLAANFRVPRVAAFFSLAAALALIPGCKFARGYLPAGAYSTSGTADCLPDITLQDQAGQPVTLSSLKGKPVLIDFIYTSCPGPCLVLTARMKKIARDLGPKLGREITLISVTVDPEHDRPRQLADYAREQGASFPGWYFLTGTPQQIDNVLANFKLKRIKEADGTIDHIIDFFMLSPDGHETRVYNPDEIGPAGITADVESTFVHG